MKHSSMKTKIVGYSQSKDRAAINYW